MPGRKFVSGEEYRFGFNGVEQEDEVAEGVNFTYFRMQDSRLGRWWSHDPKPNVSVSPYAMMENNPIRFTDPLGDTLQITGGSKKERRMFVRMLQKRTGNKYEVDKKTGIITTKGQVNILKTNSQKSSRLSILAEKTITSDKKITIDLNISKRRRGRLFLDSFLDTKVDVRDLKKMPSDLQAGLLGHILAERLNVSGKGGYALLENRQSDVKGDDGQWIYHSMHSIALVTERNIVREMNGLEADNQKPSFSPYQPVEAASNDINDPVGTRVVIGFSTIFNYGNGVRYYIMFNSIPARPGTGQVKNGGTVKTVRILGNDE